MHCCTRGSCKVPHKQKGSTAQNRPKIGPKSAPTRELSHRGPGTGRLGAIFGSFWGRFRRGVNVALSQVFHQLQWQRDSACSWFSHQVQNNVEQLGRMKMLSGETGLSNLDCIKMAWCHCRLGFRRSLLQACWSLSEVLEPVTVPLN